MSTERFRRRKRHLYILRFVSGHCYVGQTVAPRRRLLQHQRLWRKPFAMTLVGSVVGTYADAEHHEQAWRYLAHQRGHLIYASPGIVVNPTRRMTAERYALARQLRWITPKGPAGRLTRWIRRVVVGSVLGAGMIGLALTQPGLIQVLRSAYRTLAHVLGD